MAYETLTQQQKILVTMCKNPTKWYYPKDFQQDGMGALFVGYEATARFSELNRRAPGMMISERDGKYIKRRIDIEHINNWLPTLQKDLKEIAERELYLQIKPITRQPSEPTPIQNTLLDIEPVSKRVDPYRN